MTETPFMPKATAVWLVENTTLTFKQIAEFCDLHELEIKGIADGDVAKGIKAYNPILAGQLSREEIEKCSKNPEKKLVCIEMNERAIPRFGNSILFEDVIVGKVTSGTMSPSLKKGICMEYVNPKISSQGNAISINIRGKNKKGVIVKSPFYKSGSLLD